MPLRLAALPGHHPEPRTSLLTLHAPRLELVAATYELVRDQLADPPAWAARLDVPIPDDWPPELTEDVWEATRDWLFQDPERIGWGMWYLVRTEPPPRVLVGTIGLKGAPPEDGTVEVGYSVLPAYRRQGLAAEAVRALVAWAFRDPRVRRVTAETYPHLTPSIGVLEKLGFAFAGAGSGPDIIRYTLERAGQVPTG